MPSSASYAAQSLDVSEYMSRSVDQLHLKEFTVKTRQMFFSLISQRLLGVKPELCVSLGLLLEFLSLCVADMELVNTNQLE